jgi:hypothetical protein
LFVHGSQHTSKATTTGAAGTCALVHWSMLLYSWQLAAVLHSGDTLVTGLSCMVHRSPLNHWLAGRQVVKTKPFLLLFSFVFSILWYMHVAIEPDVRGRSASARCRSR